MNPSSDMEEQSMLLIPLNLIAIQGYSSCCWRWNEIELARLALLARKLLVLQYSKALLKSQMSPSYFGRRFGCSFFMLLNFNLHVHPIYYITNNKLKSTEVVF
jgi:hypothetical protein